MVRGRTWLPGARTRTFKQIRIPTTNAPSTALICSPSKKHKKRKEKIVSNDSQPVLIITRLVRYLQLFTRFSKKCSFQTFSAPGRGGGWPRTVHRFKNDLVVPRHAEGGPRTTLPQTAFAPPPANPQVINTSAPGAWDIWVRLSRLVSWTLPPWTASAASIAPLPTHPPIHIQIPSYRRIYHCKL